jgi:ribosome-associated toxin RatA of RatAB toxin-antitoxin module
MPIVEASIRITAPREQLFALSQDYALRRAWDPFVRAMRFLDGATESGVGVRVWVRAWNFLTMTVVFTGFRPPGSVAMKMLRGPCFFRSFAGTWLFKPLPGGATHVTFRYHFTTRWAWLRPIFDPILTWVLRREIAARLRGLKRGAEQGGAIPPFVRRWRCRLVG